MKRCSIARQTKEAVLLSVGWLAAALIAAPLASVVEAQTAQPAGEHADNIVVILDASGSMSERMPASKLNKMAVAKQALLEVMKQVPADTQVGLLVFSGRGYADHWLYPLAPVDEAPLAAAINLPQPNGSTPLGKYLKIGADRLLEQRQKQHGYGTFRLLVVTDGEASDRKLVERYVPDILTRGIIVDVIGVAMKANHTLATRVHSYRRADDPEGLVKALHETIAEIGAARDDAATDDESFAIIAPLPDGMAGAMLTALQNSGNQPIGQTPAEAGAADSAMRSASNGLTHSTAPGPGPTPNAGPSDRSRNIFLIAVTLIIASFVYRKIKRAAAGGGRYP